MKNIEDVIIAIQKRNFTSNFFNDAVVKSVFGVTNREPVKRNYIFFSYN